MGVSVTCDDCKRAITAGPVVCSGCAVDNAREYAAEVRAEERAGVVAWLRAMKQDDGGIIRWLATRIEEGEHISPKEGTE
jgi:hypothetical protein